MSQRIDQAFPVDTWLPLFLWRASAARAFAQRVAPDVLWSTADPWSSHLLAALVHGATGGAEGPVPWIADFRDPWTLCAVRSRGRPGWTRALDRRAETWILERADAVTYTAEETHRRSTASWPHLARKMHVLPNAYDSSAWSEAPLDGPLDGQPARGDGRLRVQFFGAFRPLSPARPLIAALAVLREIAPEALARIDICSTAPLAGEDCAAAVGAGVAEAFCAVAPQPYEAAMRTLRQADLLLISTEPGRDDIIPAKLWDYLPVGRPVLNLSPNPETAALVASTGVGVTLAPGDPLAIAALLRACVDAIDRGGPLPLRFSPNRERILAYDAGSVTSGLVSLAEGLMRSRRGLVEAL